LSQDKAMLQNVLLKKALKPSRKRELATELMERFGASMRKVCAVIKLSRVMYLYKSNARDNSAQVMRMKEITQTRVHYGKGEFMSCSEVKALEATISAFIGCTVSRVGHGK
jgi:hypothetical protein